MRNRDKIAITVDPDLLDRLERMRKRSGESRSAVFERALHAYVTSKERAEEEQKYIEAYRRHPETIAEQRTARAAAAAVFAALPWDAPR